ncbi:unnamed protein product [Brassica oleracea]
MGDNLRLKMQNINLGAEDEPVALPPEKQNLRAMISQLPRLWGVDHAVGRIIAVNCIQFVFQSEESTMMVLRRAPWSFAEWMLTVNRWYPQHR